MTTTPPPDPAADHRANYDYQGGPVDDPELADALAARIDGDVRFDAYTRRMFATDASIYERTPIGVVFPHSTADVQAVVEYCFEESIPVLPRGGGTSLAGQTTNKAVVLDFTRYMDEIIEIDPESHRIRAEPGITLGELNAAVDSHGLKFAPDPAWGDKSALGGAIGNNSTGAHSLQYGKTDAYVESLEVVLADGTKTTFGEISEAELRNQADPEGDLEAQIYDAVVQIIDDHSTEIQAQFPALKRNVSGYNFDRIIEEAETGDTINLARLIPGSEGTLCVVTGAEVSLVEKPAATSLALFTYETVYDAVSDVAPLVEHDTSAVELVDDVLLDLAADRPEFANLVDMLPDETGAVLLVEVYADTPSAAKTKLANVIADRLPDASTVESPSDGSLKTGAPVFAEDVLEAHDQQTQKKFWKLRKSGLPILLSRTTDEKHIAFLEDTAVPPENLPEYITEFQSILDDHETFASFYAHAGPGVLHIRPLINTKTVEGLETMESIADAVTDLVVEYGGSVSGEHGDGRARTQWNQKLYGDEIWELFQELKTAFDPKWLLNPGQVVYPDDEPVELTEHLRYDPDYEFDAGFDPTLQWDNDNGFQGMVELCHGCGGCRGHQETTGGVMCPTYRAANEEMLSTRGRANMLREAMNGNLDPDAHFDEEFIAEVLDLCIGCKGCKHDCPSGVDMAKLKAEVMHEHHQQNGIPFRDRLFANFSTVAKLGSMTAPVSNWLPKLPGAGLMMEKVMGIARERDLPAFQRQTFKKRIGSLPVPVPEEDAVRSAVFVPDVYTNYLHPEVGEAAVEVLQAADVNLEIAEPRDVGRPAFSKGMLDLAQAKGQETIDALLPHVEAGRDIVVVEPSDAVMLQSDYRDLFDNQAAQQIADNTYGLCEYLDRFDLDVPTAKTDETVAYHGHCQQKATAKDQHAVAVLDAAGYDVTPLDSTCCGMAGSFGYEAEHASMSRAIADILAEQIETVNGQVIAPGSSCRSQLKDLDIADPPTPAEALAKLV